MPSPAALTRKVTLNDLRAARTGSPRVPMLTCYDFTTARLMQQAGVPALLVGDSAANVILGHDSTVPIELDFLIALTAAVRRGAPLALLLGDMPFGSYHASISQGIKNVTRMLKQTGCDCVKLEVTEAHGKLVEKLTAAGVAVVAHIGLRPQAVGVMGGYKYQGRTAREAQSIVALALQMEQCGAAAILIEAVPPEVANAVVSLTHVPVIGCGAGPACHSCVIVTQDALGFNAKPPRFVPELTNIAEPLTQSYARYVEDVTSGRYPAVAHNYPMPAEEREGFMSQVPGTLGQTREQPREQSLV